MLRHLCTFALTISGRSWISGRGRRLRRGGCRLPRPLRFKTFVCQNKRIWTLQGGACAGQAPEIRQWSCYSLQWSIAFPGGGGAYTRRRKSKLSVSPPASPSLQCRDPPHRCWLSNPTRTNHGIHWSILFMPALISCNDPGRFSVYWCLNRHLCDLREGFGEKDLNRKFGHCVS